MVNVSKTKTLFTKNLFIQRRKICLSTSMSSPQVQPTNFEATLWSGLLEAVDKWDWRVKGGFPWSVEILNDFLNKYEAVVKHYGGMFPIGLRAVSEPSLAPYHQRIDGVLGIVSMNMERLRAVKAQKLTVLSMSRNQSIDQIKYKKIEYL